MLNTVVKNRIKRFKRSMRKGLGRSGLAGRLLKDAVSIFVFHDVSDHPSRFCEQYDLNITPTLFADQMDFIREHFNIINPDQLLDGDYATPAALITFDDGMPGYFARAVPLMAERDIPSIIFLNMAPIEGEIYWSGLITYLTQYDDNFCRLLRARFPQQRNTPDFLLCDRKVVADYLATIDAGEMEEKIRSFYGPFAAREDLEAVGDNPLVYFGNHFYNHYNAARLTDDELREQYCLNDQKIAAYRNARAMFAYPFGQPRSCFTERQTQLLRSFGAKAVFCSSGRLNKRGPSRIFDRIGIDASIKTVDDLFGLIQWMSFKQSYLNRTQ